MSFITFLAGNWRIITTIILVVGGITSAFSAGVHWERNIWQVKWDKQIIASKQAVIEQERKDQDISRKVATDYENEITRINDEFDVDIDSLPTQTTNGMPQVSASTGGVNETGCQSYILRLNRCNKEVAVRGATIEAFQEFNLAVTR